MSNPRALASSRESPFRSSRFRKVSLGGDTAVPYESLRLEAEDKGSTPGFVGSGKNPSASTRRLCTLWIHDESFSTDDVVLNLNQFPTDSIHVGDLLQITSVSELNKDTVRNSRTPVPSSDQARKRDNSNDRQNYRIQEFPQFNELKSDLSKRHVFIVKGTSPDQNIKQPSLQVSVSRQIADRFGFVDRSAIMLSAVEEPVKHASYVEITFRDEYLTRADMWRLVVATLANKPIFKNQRIWFMGTIKALVKAIFVKGEKVQSAFFDASTKPIFRSESARYALFIQMSKEMWDFDADGTGEIMFSKVINGFLPELFKRWAQLGVKHLVSIVLFTRLDYQRGLTAGFVHPEMEDNSSYKDFYRVVVSDIASERWARILSQLKAEFKVFLRDVSVRKPTTRHCLSLGTGLAAMSTDSPSHIIAGHPSAAIRGNILEAINLASSQFSCDYIDRDLIRTGVSIAVITAGTGLFEVDYKLLVKTTDNLIENGVGIDLVCLARMPLHSVPLFKYWQQEPQMREARESLHESNESVRHEASTQAYTSGTSMGSTSPLSFSGIASRTHLASEKSGKWRYGIPHWIDVSFWTSSTDEHRTQAAILGKQVKKANSVKPHRKAFVPRVRMYELQMMGVMEDAMSEISIPYLSKYIRIASKGHEASKDPRELQTLGQRPSTYGTTRTEPQNGKHISYEFFSSVSTASVDAMTHDHGLHNSQWMDEYDETIFHRLGRRPSIEDDHLCRAQRPLSNIPRTRRRRDHSPFNFGSSLSAQSSSADSRFGLEGKTVTEKTPKGRISTQINSYKRGSIASIASSSNTSLKKPAGLSRQISFGPRGFSTGTLKAIPSTELSAEHASSAALLGRGIRPSRLRSGTTSVPAGSAPSQMAKVSISGGLSANQDDVRDEFVAPFQKSPRPIPIRNLTAVRTPKEGTIFDTSELGKDDGKDTRIASKNGDFAGNPSRLKAIIDAYEFPSNLSPGSSMAPWLTILNPSNPHKMDATIASRLGRWQHVFPRPQRNSKIKWKSLCSPAAVPLTTEDYPSSDQLADEYEEGKYCVAPREDTNLQKNSQSQDWLLREMMAFRFSHGFQIVIGSRLIKSFGSVPTVDLFESNFSSKSGSTLFMSRGSVIHQLTLIDGTGIEVRSMTRRALSSVTQDAFKLYKPAIRTMLAEDYTSQDIDIFPNREEADWERVDSFLAGHEKPQANHFADNLQPWRARFVLIPVDPPSSGRRSLQPVNEDDEEEIRLEGIRKLTQIWQRFRYVPPNERRFQTTTRKRKDTNPLDIMYRTLNPSAIVAAELDSIGENDSTGRAILLLPGSDLYQRSNLNLSSLAQGIQSERGVRMMDRRWHWRLHYNCFIGLELTTWLLQNFRDVETREEAVDVGNDLMNRGLFQHVEQRHNFRDGNFFYQIASEYRAPRAELSRNWFGSRKVDKSVPSTPISEGVGGDSPRKSHSRSSSNGNDSSNGGTSTPTDSKRRLGVTLSKSLLYDVDHRKRSHRPEVINLHYDRLHNPDNCYHIRIEWMNVTAKLIEDAVVSWATSMDRFGLRLVEVPLSEASAISKTHPFRAPYLIKLAQYPPRKQPQRYFDANSFAAQDKADKQFYQKAIMKRFNFVLDFEAASDFPPDVDVSYSWGKLDYRYQQYIHRSGVLLAQITDDGDFLLLANRLYNNRSAKSQEPARSDNMDAGRPTAFSAARSDNHRGSPRSSPYASPSLGATQGMPTPSTGFARASKTTAFATPEDISEELETFCQDAAKLDHFYNEVLSKSSSPGPNTPFIESSIPALGLPPSWTLREVSPSPVPSEAEARTGSKSSITNSSNDYGGGSTV